MGRTTARAATIEFFVNDEPGWVSAATGAGLNIERLDTTPANTALANEVALPPANGTNLNTSILTFDAANTGLSIGFRFEVTESPSIIYRTTPNRINYEPSASGEEDWTLQLTEGPKLRAFAIEIHEREGQGPEISISAGATVLDSINTVPIFPNSFLGVLSDTPFDLVTYVHNDSTNEGFADFQFATIPEPSADFNQDGDVDLVDVNLLTAEANLPVGLAVPPADAKFDLTGNDIVDTADLDRWLTDAAMFNGFGSPYLRGDANLDVDVDVWDFDGSGDAQVLSSNMGMATGAVWGDGDFNGDGDVDVWDFDGSGDAQLLSSNMGTAHDVGATVVPEPSTLALLAMGAMGLAYGWRRRRTA